MYYSLDGLSHSELFVYMSQNLICRRRVLETVAPISKIGKLFEETRYGHFGFYSFYIHIIS